MIVQAQRTSTGASILVEESIIFIDPLNFIIQDFPNTAVDDSNQDGHINEYPIRKAADAIREILLTILTGGLYVIVY